MLKFRMSIELYCIQLVIKNNIVAYLENTIVFTQQVKLKTNHEIHIKGKNLRHLANLPYNCIHLPCPIQYHQMGTLINNIIIADSFSKRNNFIGITMNMNDTIRYLFVFPMGNHVHCSYKIMFRWHGQHRQKIIFHFFCYTESSFKKSSQ